MFLKRIKPEIIGGWKNSNGIYQKHTGISNMTHISQKGNNLFIGDNVFIEHFSYIDGIHAKVTICNKVQVGYYCSILTHSTHNSIRFMNEEFLNCVGDVYVGENTFIGPHSVIMPGTHIGKGCIVSAYSFVKGDFPDYSILRGQPAKIIGDTRAVDAKLIEQYPELKSTYYLKDENNR